jgi:SAM-dependent methyltransferase
MQSEQFQLHAEIEQRHWWFVGRRRIMRRLIGELLPVGCGGIAPKPIVVDVGCGTGGNIASLADRYECVGIDTSAEAIDLARRRFAGVKFIAGRAPADLGPTVRQARLFTLMDVLEHVEDDRALLGELVRAASPGSYFLITVPADMSLWSEHDVSFGHFRRYERDCLEGAWAGLPVRPMMVSYFNARLLPLIRRIRARNQRRGRAAGAAGTDFWIPAAPVNRMLEAVFAGESRRLVKQLRNPGKRGYSCGASLVAVLRREEAPVAERRADVAGVPTIVPDEPCPIPDVLTGWPW